MDTILIIAMIIAFLLGLFSNSIKKKFGVDIKMNAPADIFTILIAALLAFGDD